jgi:hypothetical protein
MSTNGLSALAAAMSAVAALAALAVGLLALVDSRRAAEATRRQIAHSLDVTLQSRLDPMYPDLRAVLGDLEDGVPKEIRSVLIPFYVLYSDAFAAHRDGLLDERDWLGFERELAYWAQKPTARRAWQAFRQQTWTDGFVDHVDSVHSGAPAYPNVQETCAAQPTVTWPDASDGTPETT